MTNEAERLLTEALRKVKTGGGFCPMTVGASIGLNKPQSEAAARALSNAGVLVLGFDLSAHFSPAYRKIHMPTKAEIAKSKKKAPKRMARRAAAI